MKRLCFTYLDETAWNPHGLHETNGIMMKNQAHLMTRLSTVSAPWYAQRWPWLLMLGPLVVVAAASYTGWLAFSLQDALVEDDYYKEGNAINQDLRRDEEAIRRGIGGNLRYDAESGVMSGVLRHVGGQAAPDMAPEAMPGLQLRLIHSTLPGKDITLFVRPDVNGNFSVRLPQLEKARWRILIEDAHRDWRLHASWSWPQQASVDLDPVAMKAADD
jgi:hypothetical protein